MEPVAAAGYVFSDYRTIARKRWPWILLPALLFTGLATAYSLNEDDRYEATTLAILPRTWQGPLKPLEPLELSNEVSLAESDGVVSRVEAELGNHPDVAIRSEPDADGLWFIGSANNPADAALFANTWAEKYLEVKQERAVQDITAATDSIQARLVELRAERQVLREQLDQLDDPTQRSADPDVAALPLREDDRPADDLRYKLELVTSQVDAAIGTQTELERRAEFNTVGRIVQRAAPPTSRSNAPLWRNVALGLALGLVAGLGLVLLAETRDTELDKATVDKVAEGNS